jgi:hypothetical protein
MLKGRRKYFKERNYQFGGKEETVGGEEIVTDREVGECLNPEGNGVTMGRGAEGGPGPPSGEQDKQLICNNGGDKTSMGEPGGEPDGLDATSRTHHAQST